MDTATVQQKPHEIRLGKIKATIWANPTHRGIHYRTKICCLYKDESGNWNSTDTFQREDLLAVAKVADLAHTWICRQAAQ